MEIAGGLSPAPPDFNSRDVKKRSNAEVCWVVKNGIKMTGIAAFGATHNEEELRGIVLFVHEAPKLSAEEYAAMVKKSGLRKEEDHHH